MSSNSSDGDPKTDEYYLPTPVQAKQPAKPKRTFSNLTSLGLRSSRGSSQDEELHSSPLSSLLKRNGGRISTPDRRSSLDFAPSNASTTSLDSPVERERYKQRVRLHASHAVGLMCDLVYGDGERSPQFAPCQPEQGESTEAASPVSSLDRADTHCVLPFLVSNPQQHETLAAPLHDVHCPDDGRR
jgi:hypothetical protein